MRKLLVFSMHDELSCSFILTFSLRLGIEVVFADGSFSGWCPGYSSVPEGHFTNMCPRVAGKWSIISQDQFYSDSSDWFVMCSNPVWQSNMQDLKQRKPGIKVIAQSGNDYWTFSPDICPNLLCSVSDAFHASFQVNKTLYYPEMDDAVFYYEPLKSEDRYIARQYINFFLKTEPAIPANRNVCDVCHAQYQDPGTRVDVRNLWYEGEAVCRQYFPNSDWKVHGLQGKDGEAHSQETKKLGDWIRASSLTIHAKTFEGYGMNGMHSLMCGRPVVIDGVLLRTRTLSRFIIPYETGMFVDFRNTLNLIDFMRWYWGQDLELIQRMCEKTRKVFDAIVNWDEQADRVRRIVENAR